MAMVRYKQLGGPSGVVAYRLAPDAIEVRFVDGHTYTYNYAVPGQAIVEHMKQLAREGKGLATFISQHVRHHYAVKR